MSGRMAWNIFLVGGTWLAFWGGSEGGVGPGRSQAQVPGSLHAQGTVSSYTQGIAGLRSQGSGSLGAQGPAASETASAGGASSAWESFLQSEPVRADAQLNDVFFLDSQTGWAVGDRGVIWHTSDGGRKWTLQHSNTTARLLSVFFLDRHMGWVVGGSAQPYTGASTGLLLATEDSGRTWAPPAKLLLPTLHRIRMVDPQAGYVIGESSPMFHTGIGFTGDGGRSWEPLLGVRTAGWRAGDFFNPATGAVGGGRGAVGVVRRSELEPSRIPPLGRRGVWRVELVRPVHGWLVGDGGLLMRTDDGGATWQTPPTLPPLEILRQFDLYALAVRGPNVWAAGSPGTRVFYSSDAGQTWTAFPTGQSLPIYGLHFADEQHGWAVGALGVILATEDGGRTWTRQRSGGVRAALLAMIGQVERIPWEALAKWAGQEGYLTSVYVIGSPSGAQSAETLPAHFEAWRPDRVHEAAVRLGAAGAQTAWQFPLGPRAVDRQARHIAARWDEANDGRGLQALQAELVRQIRTWRPEVVLTHDASPRGDDPLGHLVNQAVLQAVELAADPTAHVDQLTQVGLSAWSVKRIFGITPAQVEGDFQLPRSALVLRLGGAVADLADQARALLGANPSGGLAGTLAEADPIGWFGAIRASQVGFRLLRSRVPQEGTPKDFFERIILQPGGEARRWLPELAGESLSELQQQAQRRRHLEAIVQQATQDPRLGQSLLAQTRQWVQGLEPSLAGQFLYHLGRAFIERGQWPAAAEVLELLVDRQPEHPASGPAIVWLVQYYASAEAAWRVYGGQRRTTPQLATPAWDCKALEERWERAAAMARLLEKYHPELFLAPEVRFPLAVADRSRGYPKNAERWFFVQRRSLTRDAWWASAQAEAWLDQPQGEPPKPLIFCTPAAPKPRLDGRLDEPFWQQTKPVLLGPEGEPSGSGGWAAEVRLAYDTEFLYLAVRCPRIRGVEYPASSGPRPQDPDLSDHDRVEFFLDLDRDYTTYWHLTIDHRGWVAEDCWGDTAWNPRWFVAAGGDEDAWTAEAAIGLDQLTGFFPKANSVWTIGLQRIVPGVGVWTFPRSGQAGIRPADFGLLIFQ